MISYAIFIYSGKFHKLPLNSEPTQSFYLHGKENSSKFWSFPETSMTMHFLILDD